MKETGSKIPAGFWATPEGCTLNVVMHISAWDGLDCLNDQIEALALLQVSRWEFPTDVALLNLCVLQHGQMPVFRKTPRLITVSILFGLSAFIFFHVCAPHCFSCFFEPRIRDRGELGEPWMRAPTHPP